MFIPSQFGFYAILTEPLIGYEQCTKILVDAGIAFVQLRIKKLPESEILPIAEKMREITLGTSTCLIINDFPDIARQCEADGVHIGQDDMPFDDVRSIVGSEIIVGVSTHNPLQTKAACKLQPDYIGIGPVFPTPTKDKPDPVIGIEGMKAMLVEATVPAVAIGGIDLSNLHQVLEAGVMNFCMVRQFTQSNDPVKVLKEMKRIYRRFYPTCY